MPAISVLMPVKNGQATLASSIESIRSQTFRDFELLLIDDHSEDDSTEIAYTFSQKDPRIKLLPAPGEGIAAALRHGFYRAESEFIARMDCDDISEPHRLQRQWDYLQAQPRIGVLATSVRHLAVDDSALGMHEFVEWNNSLLSPEQIYRARFIETPLIHPSVMFRREIGMRHGLWRSATLPEDYELWLRWLESGVRFAKLPECLLTWVDSPTRVSRVDRSYDAEAFYRAKSPYLARYLRRKLSNEKRVLILGAGREARKRVLHLAEQGVEIAAWVDVDPKKLGKVYLDAPVISTKQLAVSSDTMVLSYLAGRGQREQAVRFLHSLGYRSGKDYILCA